VDLQASLPNLSRVSGQELCPVRKQRPELKAFLLAAGQGTRLRPITATIPKCLVPIRGTSMLEIWLELCSRNGIDEVLINLHTHVDVVREALRNRECPVKVRVVEENFLLGSAGTLKANQDWVKDEVAFWVLYADVLTTANLRRMAEFHGRRQTVATIGLNQVTDPSRCGVAICDVAGVIREFEEKPQKPRSNWVFSGLMIASPTILESVPDRLPADIGFDILPRLVGRMVGYPIYDYLIDIGTLGNYREAQRSWPGLKYFSDVMPA
jgi:mannose-1-phosphate guanylyltransferase